MARATVHWCDRKVAAVLLQNKRLKVSDVTKTLDSSSVNEQSPVDPKQLFQPPLPWLTWLADGPATVVKETCGLTRRALFLQA